MTIELTMLVWSMVLGLIHVAVAATLSTARRGLRWNAGNRDGEVAALTGAAARAARASTNFQETFPFFAAAVLAVLVAQRADAHTALGAQLYFWARLAYLPVYVVGIPYLRTVVWAVSLVGLLMVLGGLL
ncbi:MAPEG family protein [Dyella lutea]|uniref:MAPEG family protein n=1 Tax=Dyella lutea TaxID=2950441 RepID=A0ABT1FER8_9GAMM|nr:MAPEG family protein [Dyella lutea]MCP1375874.1 MAPEG family protein [Dyella lutea]